MECSNCGVSDTSTKLFDVISGEGIIKLCKNCLSSENVRINRPGGIPPGKEKKQSTYERLSSIAGIDNPQEHKRKAFGKQDNEELKKQEVSLRDLVDKKFDSFVDKNKEKKENSSKRDDLIDHFHWVIMRARRARKMSVSQLAKEIKEPERVIKDAERGIIPEGYDLIIKLENALNINLLRPGVEEQLSQHPKKLGFDDVLSKNITISDLKEMKKQDPGLDLEVREPESGKKVPYWKMALSKIMKKRKKKENEVVFREIGSNENSGDSEKDFEEEITKRKERDKIDKIIERKKSKQEKDNTSLQMTTSFSGQDRDDEKESEKSDKEKDKKTKKDISDEIRKTRQMRSEENNDIKKGDSGDSDSKKKKEMSQEEIDDLIFGR